MRKIVGYENHFIKGHNVVLGEKAIDLAGQLQFPVTFGYGIGGPGDLCGTARDFERDSQGVLSMAFEFSDEKIRETVEKEDFSPTIYCTNIQVKTEGQFSILTYGRLRAITLIPFYNVRWEKYSGPSYE